MTPAEPSRISSYGALAFALIFCGFAALALYRVVTGRVPTLARARTVDPETVTVTFKRRRRRGRALGKDEVR